MRQKKYLTVLDPLQEKFGDFMTGILLLGELFAELMWGASILIALGKILPRENNEMRKMFRMLSIPLKIRWAAEKLYLNLNFRRICKRHVAHCWIVSTAEAGLLPVTL